MSRPLVLVVTLVVLAGVFGSLWFYAGGASGPEPLVIRRVTGDVQRLRGGATEAGEAGMSLLSGDRLRTGQDGRVTLDRGSGTSIDLLPNTDVTVDLRDGLVELGLEHGQVRARVRPDAGAVRVSNRGRTVLATDGEVRVVAEPGGTLDVESHGGSVGVGGVNEVTALAAGDRLHVGADGRAVVWDVSPALLLDVQWPSAAPGEQRVTVTGHTEPGATVRVLSPANAAEPVRAGHDGSFVLDVHLPVGTNELLLGVRDAFGRERQARGALRRLEAGRPLRIDLEYRTP